VVGMGENHGGGLGGFAPHFFMGVLSMDSAPQKNQVLAPHFS